jgi:hypothetical protein
MVFHRQCKSQAITLYRDMKRNFLLFFLFMVYSASCNPLSDNNNPASGISRVWAVDDGEKIRKDDIANPLASDPDNRLWVNETVNLFGGRNEIVAFQLIIEAGKNGASGVNVTISDLVSGTSVIPGSATGPADPFDYRGRYTELFTEHYLNMVKRSPPLWFFAESAAPSAYYSGWVPDCLIPFSAPPGKGGAPFSIDPDMNQGVWVDILIPENAVAGLYEGNADISIDGNTVRRIPVSLEVYDFTLPDSTHIRNMFGYYPGTIARRHGVDRTGEAFYDLELKYHQLAHRHRCDLVTEVENLDEMTAHFRRYYTGEAYSESYGYAGPGKNTGNMTFSIGYGGDFPKEYGGSVSNMNKEDWWKGSDAWENWFKQNAPGVERHKYLFPDEPDWKGPAGKLGTGSMDTIRMQATWSHTNPGPGKNIPTLVTNRIKDDLKGYVDFWSISSEEWTLNLTSEDIASEKALGHQAGIYNGYRPGMGAVVSDADAVEFRVMPWIVWKYNIDQYFYWSTSFWTNVNVFVNPLTYEDRINGDGTFFYPGQDYLFVNENRQLAGPLSSIRAKNWRRGAQDYEYLWLAEKMGLGSQAGAIVDECVPLAVWEAKDLNHVSWPERGYRFETYRRQLAELLSSVSSFK